MEDADPRGQWRDIFASSESYVEREDAEKNIRDIADALIQGFVFVKVE